MEVKKLIQRSIIKSYTEKTNIFDIVLEEMGKWYEKPAHNFTELRQKESKKERGTYFEILCKIYLQNCDPKTIQKSLENHIITNVWLLEEVPKEVLEKLTLKRRDFGIDIICELSHGEKYIAVQSKYRKRGRKTTNIITWKMLSTFYALVLRSGPWERYAVMTNAEYITHMGKKTYKDISIGYNFWKKIPIEVWIKMGRDIEKDIKENNKENNKENTEKDTQENTEKDTQEGREEESIEFIRRKRLERFQ